MSCLLDVGHGTLAVFPEAFVGSWTLSRSSVEGSTVIGDGDIWREAGVVCLCALGAGGSYRGTAGILRAYLVKPSVNVRTY